VAVAAVAATSSSSAQLDPTPDTASEGEVHTDESCPVGGCVGCLSSAQLDPTPAADSEGEEASSMRDELIDVAIEQQHIASLRVG